MDTLETYRMYDPCVYAAIASHLSEKWDPLMAFSRARCTHTSLAKVTPHQTKPSRIRVELNRKDVLICCTVCAEKQKQKQSWRRVEGEGLIGGGAT